MRKPKQAPSHVHAREATCPLDALAHEFARLRIAVSAADAAGESHRRDQIDERMDMIRAGAVLYTPTTPIGAAFLLGLAHEQFQYYLDTCAPETPPGFATLARLQLETAIKQTFVSVATFIEERHKVPPRLGASDFLPSDADLTRLLQSGGDTAGEGLANG